MQSWTVARACSSRPGSGASVASPASPGDKRARSMSPQEMPASHLLSGCCLSLHLIAFAPFSQRSSPARRSTTRIRRPRNQDRFIRGVTINVAQVSAIIHSAPPPRSLVKRNPQESAKYAQLDSAGAPESLLTVAWLAFRSAAHRPALHSTVPKAIARRPVWMEFQRNTRISFSPRPEMA